MDPYKPYQPPNPYAPPIASHHPEPVNQDQGSYPLGFFAGLVFALIGLIVVYVRGKPESKRGAGHGFLLRVGLMLLAALVL